jgi:hypothetical protein
VKWRFFHNFGGPVESNQRRIIELLQILASEPMPSRGFETPENEFERHQQRKHEAAVREIAQGFDICSFGQSFPKVPNWPNGQSPWFPIGSRRSPFERGFGKTCPKKK